MFSKWAKSHVNTLQLTKKKDMGYVYSTRVSPRPSFSNSGSEGLNEKHMRESFTRGKTLVKTVTCFSFSLMWIPRFWTHITFPLLFSSSFLFSSLLFSLLLFTAFATLILSLRWFFALLFSLSLTLLYLIFTPFVPCFSSFSLVFIDLVWCSQGNLTLVFIFLQAQAY